MLQWNFSDILLNYFKLKFSDGSELDVIYVHRIFNKEKGAFTYSNLENSPIGTTCFNEKGQEVKLVSREEVNERVKYYNIITEKHFNCFVNGILNSSKLNNLYKIKDMKFVKDNRELATREEYAEVDDKFFYGLRLAEQPKEFAAKEAGGHNTVKEYVQHLKNLMK